MIWNTGEHAYETHIGYFEIAIPLDGFVGRNGLYAREHASCLWANGSSTFGSASSAGTGTTGYSHKSCTPRANPKSDEPASKPTWRESNRKPRTVGKSERISIGIY